MADVELVVGGRHYAIACRDGGEDHLRALGQHVDRKAREAEGAVGGMSEARQLLFAALLIADELTEARAAVAGGPGLATATLDALATRIEAVADTLERATSNA